MLYHRKDEQHKCFSAVSLSLEKSMFSWQRRLKSGVMDQNVGKDHRQPESLSTRCCWTVSMSFYESLHFVQYNLSNKSHIQHQPRVFCYLHLLLPSVRLGVNTFNLAGSPELLQRGVHWPGHLWLLGGHTAGALQRLLVVQSVKDKRGRMCQRHTGSWMFTQSFWLVYTPTVTEMNKRWIQ